MKQLQTTEMHLAYVWNCDNCGAENFERAVVYEFAPGEREHVGDDAETGNWMTHPKSVKCPKCKAEFDAKHFRAQDDDSEK